MNEHGPKAVQLMISLALGTPAYAMIGGLLGMGLARNARRNAEGPATTPSAAVVA